MGAAQVTSVTRRPVRLPRTLMNVLSAIAQSPPSAPAWSISIRERTGLGKDRVFGALEKLLMTEWITAYWEDAPEGWEPRRFYRLTEAGRQRYDEAVQAEAGRAAGPPWWQTLLQAVAG